MVLENLQVKHRSFGDGVVTSTNGKYFTVNFSAGNKTFVYPDIFEKFLTLSDGTISDEIRSDLDAANAVKQSIINQKAEENERAKTRGIVIPGKEMVAGEGEDDENRIKSSELEEI